MAKTSFSAYVREDEDDLEFTEESSGEEEFSLRDKMILKGVEELLSSEKLFIKSDTSRTLALHLAVGQHYANYFGCDAMDLFIKEIQKFSISVDRKGRSEVIQMFNRAVDQDEFGFMEGNKIGNMSRKLLGGTKLGE